MDFKLIFPMGAYAWAGSLISASLYRRSRSQGKNNIKHNIRQ